MIEIPSRSCAEIIITFDRSLRGTCEVGPRFFPFIEKDTKILYFYFHWMVGWLFGRFEWHLCKC